MEQNPGGFASGVPLRLFQQGSPVCTLLTQHFEGIVLCEMHKENCGMC